MRSRPAPQIGFSFEYLMWLFTRISGLVLLLLGFLASQLRFSWALEARSMSVHWRAGRSFKTPTM